MEQESEGRKGRCLTSFTHYLTRAKGTHFFSLLAPPLRHDNTCDHRLLVHIQAATALIDHIHRTPPLIAYGGRLDDKRISLACSLTYQRRQFVVPWCLQVILLCGLQWHHCGFRPLSICWCHVTSTSIHFHASL